MSVIKMYVSVTGSTAGNAAIDIPEDGIIDAVSLGCTGFNATPADGDYSHAEVSFMSVNSFGTNDVRGSLCTVSVGYAGAAAADGLKATPSVPFCMMNNLGVRVSAGERVYLHAINKNSDQQVLAVAYLFIRDKLDMARPAPRRR